jgi:serine/threonine protein kinase
VQAACPNPYCRKPIPLDGGAAGVLSRCSACGTALRPPAVGRIKEELPASIARYKISRELGRGAFGIVYQGLDESLARDVAIKVLNEKALGSATAGDRFLREAKVMAKMHHNHIVPVFELGKLGACPYIVSLFIKGRTLAEAIPDGGMPPAQAITYVLQLLAALAYAHERGVTHRDIKPTNILLDEDDQSYLTDFGLAGLVGQHEMTRAGSRMGTPAYMPPEQCEGKLDLIGPASDQYSAGVVLYELLTSRTPFEGGGPLAAMLYAVVNAVPDPPSAHCAGLDSRLDAICMRALAKKPSDRFPSCLAFAEALKTWKDAPPLAPTVIPAAPVRSPLVARTTISTAPSRPSEADRLPPPSPVPVTKTKPNQRPKPIDLPDPKPAERLPVTGGSRHTFLIVASALAGAVVLAAAGIILFLTMGQSPDPPKRPGMNKLLETSGKK